MAGSLPHPILASAPDGRGAFTPVSLWPRNKAPSQAPGPRPPSSGSGLAGHAQETLMRRVKATEAAWESQSVGGQPWQLRAISPSLAVAWVSK